MSKEIEPLIVTFESLKNIKDPPKGFIYDKKTNCYIIKWGGSDYEIESERISTPLALLCWIRHMSEKSTEAWKGMTPYAIGAFIQKVCIDKGWDPYGNH